MARKLPLEEPTMHRHHYIVLAVLYLSLPLFNGCGRGNPLNLQAISGCVNLDSKPLDHGSIQFCPDREQGGRFAGSLIVDGKYDVPGDKGLLPGKYTVRISAAEPGSNTAPNSLPGQSMSKPLKERIPAQYNAKSNLTVEVKTGGGNVFDFALNSRPGTP
jgi:hypothetical protein